MALTAEQAAKKVDALYAELVARRNDSTSANRGLVHGIDTLERYFNGDHPLVFMSDEWKKYHQGRYRDFRDNWCEVVGRAAPERTEVFGIRLGDDADAQSNDEKVLWRDWSINDGPAQSAQGFLSGAIARRSFALVWGDDNDDPVLTWEHAGQCIVDGKWGLKAWVSDDLEYATLYSASDGVWKWQRPRSSLITNGQTPAGLYVPTSFAEGGWVPREGTGDDSWPIPNPLDVMPLVEFPNRPVLGVGPISDLAGTIAMQNAVNLLWAYLFTSADHASMPARVVMGAEPPKMPILNEAGEVVGSKPLDIEALKQGRMLWLTGQNAKIGQWDAAKLDVFTSAINVMVKHLASQTRTPIHYIMGELGNVNGETLTATELPLAQKVREGHKHLTRPMREVFRRMALVRGNAAVAEACRTAVVQWKNPETSSDAQTSDAALKDKTVGWPFAAILERRYGLSQPEIQRVLDQRQSEAENDPNVAAARDLANGTADAPAGGQ